MIDPKGPLLSPILPALALCVLIAASIACAGEVEGGTPLGSTEGPAAAVAPRGARLLGIDVSQAPGEGYDQAFHTARQVGMQFTSLSLAWDDLEPRPGEFATEPNWLAAADLYYPAQSTPLALTLAPIDTNRIRLPADLQGRPFDDPQVIARFERLLDHVMMQIPDVELAVLAIGNEVDAALGADPDAWASYRTFFEAAAAHTRRVSPGVRVGVKVTMGGLLGETRELALALNARSDIILVTYYSLESDFGVRSPLVVHDDLAALVGVYPGRPIGLLEAGYPSSEVLGSSEERQAEFARQIFRAWDAQAEQIALLNFTWLTDASQESVEAWERYYGLSDRRFAAYLASLGLRRANGQPKPALDVLAAEAHARGW